jgi:hypothetical protein
LQRVDLSQFFEVASNFFNSFTIRREFLRAAGKRRLAESDRRRRCQHFLNVLSKGRECGHLRFAKFSSAGFPSRNWAVRASISTCNS